MSVTVLDRHCSERGVKAHFRSQREGPEHDLVSKFISESRIRVPRGNKVTIFREPHIESGFPDLVLVVWHQATAENWHPLRSELTKNDVRLMHYLVQAGPKDTSELQALFGKKVEASLHRLDGAATLYKRRRLWTARPLSKIFATRHIIAIEAKMCEWGAALRQAHLNTWFASASYVMVPRVSNNSKLLTTAQALGLGVRVCNDVTFDVRHTAARQLPLSYASWLFNEWACEAARKQFMVEEIPSAVPDGLD